MKTFIKKLFVVIIPLIALTIVITISNGLAHKVERAQAAAMVNTQLTPEMLGNSVGAVMDNLFITSER